jgi:hypothetical protein
MKIQYFAASLTESNTFIVKHVSPAFVKTATTANVKKMTCQLPMSSAPFGIGRWYKFKSFQPLLRMPTMLDTYAKNAAMGKADTKSDM